MPHVLPITGEYPPDWPQIADRVRAEADHRCIRCHHRYKTGQHGKGEWSACDDKCRHHGPLAFIGATGEIVEIMNEDMPARNALAIASARKGASVVAHWRILTVHHLTGNKSDCVWFNLLPLCQRCHLFIQATVNPEVPYFLEHDEWFKPYAAGFYGRKYEGKDYTREQVMARLDELLAHERIA